MGNQNDDTEPYSKLWVVRANNCSVGAKGVHQVPDMEFWGFSARVACAKLQMTDHIISCHYSSGDLDRVKWLKKQGADIVSECQAEVEGLDQEEGYLFDRLEELSLAVHSSSEWSTFDDLVEETTKMIRDQQACEGDNMEGTEDSQ